MAKGFSILPWAVVMSQLTTALSFSTAFNSYNATPFDWDAITPSANLQFHACAGSFQCARLSVPMDWNSTATDGEPRVALALVKIPAKVPVTDPRYAGPVLLNPGGPGQSGTKYTFTVGPNLQTILDLNDDRKLYDIISWDPRGVNNTTPRLPDLSSDALRQWTLETMAVGYDFHDPEVLAQQWAYYHLYGEVISNTTETPLGRYVSTPNVARDMVEIIERHGEWREREARHLLANNTSGYNDSAAALARTRWRRGAERLQYWGFSYGTFLGQVFATLYPDRVGRMVLDGVVDADDWAAGAPRSVLTDADQITRNFTAACAAAGPAACALAAWAPGDGPALQRQLDAFLDSLKLSPIGGVVAGQPVVGSQSAVVNAIYGAWYKAFSFFAPTATTLFQLSQGNLTAFAAAQARVLQSAQTTAALAAVQCSDGPFRGNATKADFLAGIAPLERASARFAPAQAASQSLGCYGLRLAAQWRLAGPVGGVRTRAPLLFAGQTLDPVTPLGNARAAVARWPGSGLLEAQGVGHTTLSYPNTCALREVARYFARGTVAVAPTVCAPVAPVFAEPVPPANGTMEERQRWKATLELAQ